MNLWWDDILFGAVFVAVFFLLWGLIRRRHAKEKGATERWRVFAKKYGLQEQEAQEQENLLFAVENHGFAFSLEKIVTEGKPAFEVGNVSFKRGDDIEIYTRMQLGIPGIPRQLRVYQTKLSSRIGKALGMQDIRTGDDGFDHDFIIKGKDPDEVKRYLTPPRRFALQAFLKDAGPIELRETGLFLERPGMVGSIPELERLYMKMGELAAKLGR